MSERHKFRIPCPRTVEPTNMKEMWLGCSRGPDAAALDVCASATRTCIRACHVAVRSTAGAARCRGQQLGAAMQTIGSALTRRRTHPSRDTLTSRPHRCVHVSPAKFTPNKSQLPKLASPVHLLYLRCNGAKKSWRNSGVTASSRLRRLRPQIRLCHRSERRRQR